MDQMSTTGSELKQQGEKERGNKWDKREQERTKGSEREQVRTRGSSGNSRWSEREQKGMIVKKREWL